MTAAQLQFHLGVVPPSDHRLLAPTTAASIIQQCYQRHRRQAVVQAAATCLQGWYRLAIVGVRAAAHRRLVSDIPTANLSIAQIIAQFDKRRKRQDAIYNEGYNAILADFKRQTAIANAEFAHFERQAAIRRAEFEEQLAELNR